jgi:signal transduction histidine kinase
VISAAPSLRQLWRITTFRLTVLYGLVFAVGAVALLGMIYLQSSGYLTRRVDGILNAQADGLAKTPAGLLQQRIADELALSGPQTSLFAEFAADGRPLAGNLRAPPAGLIVDGPPLETPAPPGFASPARLIARRLAGGRTLVVGRDIRQLREIRAILTVALIWSGLAIVLIVLVAGVALSVRPIRRLQALSAAGQKIAAGDLKQRMPVSPRRDELDMFAAAVNAMVEEVERLMVEVKGATETIAHDLRTPLTHARTQLHRLQASPQDAPQAVPQVIAEIDAVLDRFRALLRISELEARDRRSGFRGINLAEVLRQVVELYQPLAEARGAGLSFDGDGGALIDADHKLLFEAVSNLVDNAIKFTAARVWVRLLLHNGGALIVVEDDGPGIPIGERSAVLQRFYRGERGRMAPGSGLGLSIVAAIVRLHRFELTLEDARPGLRAIIDCRPAEWTSETRQTAPSAQR